MKDSFMKRKLVAVYEFLYEKHRMLILRTKYRLKIMPPKKTIRYIAKHKCCIARFGDGEFDLIHSSRDLHFQKRNPEIAKQLSEILSNNNPRLLLCIPRCLDTVRGCNEHSGTFWIEWGRKDNHHQKIVRLIRDRSGKYYRFGDSQITRPYIDWKTKKRADETFPMLKSLWEKRDIIIVEGSQTRLGVGNDLFSGASSVKRILAPAVGAFDARDKIKQAILNHHNGELIIMALGPTATVLAAEFAETDIQALDIGNIDIEYEWYLRNAKTRIAIPGKFTNEAKDGRVYTKCMDSVYLSQIVEEIS